MIETAYLMFWLAYSFDWDGVHGVLVGVFFGWDGVLGVLEAYSFDWDGIFVALIGVLVFLAYSFYLGMFRVVAFAFSVEKSTPAGKKFASGAGGAGDKLQLCRLTIIDPGHLFSFLSLFLSFFLSFSLFSPSSSLLFSLFLSWFPFVGAYLRSFSGHFSNTKYKYK